MLKVLKLILIPLSYLIILYVFFSIGNIYPRYSYILMAIGSIFASLIIYLIFKKKVRVDGDGKNIKKLNDVFVYIFLCVNFLCQIVNNKITAFWSVLFLKILVIHFHLRWSERQYIQFLQLLYLKKLFIESFHIYTYKPLKILD